MKTNLLLTAFLPLLLSLPVRSETPGGGLPSAGAALSPDETAYLKHTDSVPAPRLAVEEDAVLTFDLDVTGDGKPERFHSLRSLRDGKAGYVWSVYTPKESGGGLRLLGEVTAHPGALAATAWRKDRTTRGIYTFHPGGAGKGTLSFHKVDGDGIHRLEQREIAAHDNDRAEYDSIFAGKNGGDGTGITLKETPVPKKPNATAPATPNATRAPSPAETDR